MEYLQLKPGSTLPNISNLNPFRSVVIVEEMVTPEWQEHVSDWLVTSGCLYMMAWGEQCSSWDNSVDYANLKACDYGEIPEDQFVMTTWHEHESLHEVFWFSKYTAFHPTVDIKNTLLLHISHFRKEDEYITEYANT